MATSDLHPPARPLDVESDVRPRTLLPGTVVADWLVIGVIREDLEHVLYSVTFGPAGLPAALKLIDANHLHDGRYYRRLRRSARRWKRVAHPHVARLVDAGKTPVGPYLATAPFTGSALIDVLEDDWLEPDEAATLAGELASGLDAILAEGLTPSAISPADIVLSDHGAVLIDPGIGRGVPGNSHRDTDQGVPYLSPEEAMGEVPVLQSVVYSLACVLHHCLAGAPPYPRELPQAVIYAHITEPPSYPREWRSSLPAAVDGVFERAMATEPDERHSTPGEFAEELASALGMAGATLLLPERSSAFEEREIEKPEAEESRAAEPVLAGELMDDEPEVEKPARPRSRPALRVRARRAALVAAAVAACGAGGYAAGSTGDGERAATPAPAATKPTGPPLSAVAARRVAAGLRARRARLRRQLAGAKTRKAQAAAAGALADIHALAARRAPDATPPELRRALRATSGAYSRMAAGAARGNGRAWSAGRTAVARTDRALARALRRASTQGG